jgi:hypothetical protein
MNNYARLLLINKKKNQKINKNIEKILEPVKENEIYKLKNPKKGYLYVHIDNDKNYFFYQFTGKKWEQIE